MSWDNAVLKWHFKLNLTDLNWIWICIYIYIFLTSPCSFPPSHVECVAFLPFTQSVKERCIRLALWKFSLFFLILLDLFLAVVVPLLQGAITVSVLVLSAPKHLQKIQEHKDNRIILTAPSEDNIMLPLLLPPLTLESTAQTTCTVISSERRTLYSVDQGRRTTHQTQNTPMQQSLQPYLITAKCLMLF